MGNNNNHSRVKASPSAVLPCLREHRLASQYPGDSPRRERECTGRYASGNWNCVLRSPRARRGAARINYKVYASEHERVARGVGVYVRSSPWDERERTKERERVGA